MCSALKDEKPGCTLCILAFSSFSSLISALKDEKTRMHIVHPSFFILELTLHTSHHTPHTSHRTPHTSHLPPPASQDSSLPGRDSSQPGSDSSQPGRDPSQPGRDSSQPGRDSSQPGTDSSQPSCQVFNRLWLCSGARMNLLLPIHRNMVTLQANSSASAELQASRDIRT